MNTRTFKGNKAFVGALPEDFLRLNSHSGSSETPQVQLDEEYAAALQQRYDQQAALGFGRGQFIDINQYKAHAEITFVNANLNKNYGLMPMSLYIRLRIGHTTYETRTSSGCGKVPKWNETIKW